MLFKYNIILLSLLLLVISDPLVATPIGQVSNSGINFVRILVSLIFCLFLAVGIIFIINKVMGNHGGKIPLSNLFNIKNTKKMHINIIEKHRVNQNIDIVLLQYNSCQYLIALSDNNINLIEKSGIITISELEESADV